MTYNRDDDRYYRRRLGRACVSPAARTDHRARPVSDFPYAPPPPRPRAPWRSCLAALAVFVVMSIGFWVGLVWLWEKLT